MNRPGLVHFGGIDGFWGFGDFSFSTHWGFS